MLVKRLGLAIMSSVRGEAEAWILSDVKVEEGPQVVNLNQLDDSEEFRRWLKGQKSTKAQDTDSVSVEAIATRGRAVPGFKVNATTVRRKGMWRRTASRNSGMRRSRNKSIWFACPPSTLSRSWSQLC
jgi:hypothetical protein